MNALIDSAHLLKTLTSIFSLLSLCLLAYIIVHVFLSKPQQPLMALADASATTKAEKSMALQPVASFDSYAAAVKNRNIFGPPTPAQATQSVSVQQQLPKPNPVETLQKRFKVKAILLSGQPQAIIEDTQEHRTLFISPGDELAGMPVQGIQEHSVIIKNQGHRMELTL